MALPNAVSIRSCIVDGCDWTYREPDLGAAHPRADFSGAEINVIVVRAMSAHYEVVEVALREHMESHTVDEYARTIHRLRQVERRAESVAHAPIPPMHSDTARYILGAN